VISLGISLIASALLVAAWWYPNTELSAALGWSAVALFFAALSAPRARLKRLYLAGIATYIGGFYWLYGTIKDFGGFPTPAAVAIFALFVCGSAVQFLIWGFAFGRLPGWSKRWGLRLPLSWLVAHHFWIKIFPWDFGHTQLAFVPFAQLAGISGVTGITFLMMWVVETLCARRDACLMARFLSLASFGGAMIYGLWVAEQLRLAPAEPLSTVMIQGNVSLQRKHDTTYFTVNRDQYLQASARVSGRDTLIIWPESTITDFIPADTTNASQAPTLPYLNDGSAFLVGGLTFRSKEEYYNSSILIRPDASLDTPYNKMILMPFGEYTPFAKFLPWLADINSTAGQFSAGSAPSVLSFKTSTGKEVRLSPLICYEDIVPTLAREATARGAELLVNQTNDAWFGDTVAPYQHHLIAAFRAIENRRYLLRSTNTGLTAVVDPMGRTVSMLLPYTESTLALDISLLNYRSIYTSLPIYALWLLLSAGLVASIVLKRRAK
jgi:apolipoprotein N-acyltransferase